MADPDPPADPRSLRAELETAKAEIEAAWFGIEHGYEIEPRRIIAEESKTNGFKYPLAQAIHTIWKREPKVEAVEADRARLQQEYAQLRESVALLTHLVDPHRLQHIARLSLAELQQGLHQQCVVRVDEAETELEALRQALRQLAQQWQTEARQSESWTMTAVAKDSCAAQLLARLRERST